MPFDSTPTEITVDTPASLMLEAAIRLIEQPKHWCRGIAEEIIPGGGRAYCAWGAVREATGSKWADGFRDSCDALNLVAARYGYANIAYLNDDAHTTHAMVLEVMREAAEYARDKP